MILTLPVRLQIWHSTGNCQACYATAYARPKWPNTAFLCSATGPLPPGIVVNHNGRASFPSFICPVGMVVRARRTGGAGGRACKSHKSACGCCRRPPVTGTFPAYGSGLLGPFPGQILRQNTVEAGLGGKLVLASRVIRRKRMAGDRSNGLIKRSSGLDNMRRNGEFVTSCWLWIVGPKRRVNG